MIQESYTNYLNKEGTLILVGVPIQKKKLELILWRFIWEKKL